jgi:hypothetical protein
MFMVKIPVKTYLFLQYDMVKNVEYSLLIFIECFWLIQSAEHFAIEGKRLH